MSRKPKTVPAPKTDEKAPSSPVQAPQAPTPTDLRAQRRNVPTELYAIAESLVTNCEIASTGNKNVPARQGDHNLTPAQIVTLLVKNNLIHEAETLVNCLMKNPQTASRLALGIMIAEVAND